VHTNANYHEHPHPHADRPDRDADADIHEEPHEPAVGDFHADRYPDADGHADANAGFRDGENLGD
jgi:hypothetical protein